MFSVPSFLPHHCGGLHRGLLVPVLAAALSFLGHLHSATGSEPAASPRLLLPAGRSDTVQTVLTPPAPPTRVRRLKLNPDLAGSAADWLRVGQTLRLDLLEHQNITVAVETVEPTVTGGLVVHGRATSDEASAVALTWESGSLTGFVSLPGLGRFRIVPVATGDVIEVQKIESRPPGFCGTGYLAKADAAAGTLAKFPVGRLAGGLPPADTLPEPTVVDVLFLYTPQAVAVEGDEEGLRRRVLDAVEGTNHRLTNSLINVRIHPVFIGLIPYVESGDMSLDLSRLASGTGGLERSAVVRNDYKADLAVLITEVENQGVGGQALDHTPPGGDPTTGFVVIQRNWLGRDHMVLAHELGHLLGCGHDREHAGEDQYPEYYRVRKPYIFGHRFEVEGVTYIDVMSYEPGIYVPYYSNPRLTLDGVPLGVPAENPRPSDCARTIHETAPYVARYRTALSRIGFAHPRFIAAEQDGTLTVRLMRTGNLNTSTRVTVLLDTTSSAKADQDYLRPTTTVVTFGTNQATADLIIPLVQDELAEGEETIRLSLGSVQGNHGIGWQGTSEAVILDADMPASFSEVEFPEGPVAVMESAGDVRIRVAYTGPAAEGPVELPYRTADATALASQDYQAVHGTVTFSAGATAQEIVIPLLPRPEAGPDRTFALIVGTRTNTVRILDEQRLGALTANPGAGLFPDGALNGMVRGDGKILVWGDFSRLAGQKRSGIALLNAEGLVDDSFQPPEILKGHRLLEGIGNGSPNAEINAARVQSDGKLVLAGTFSRVNGQPKSTLIRLHSDGTLDNDFGRELRFDGAAYDLAIQPDGRILVAGSFEYINGVRRPFIARLLADGTVDESFRPNGGPTSSWTVILLSLALQADGGILIGGYFEKVDGVSRQNLARLKPDGTLDPAFKLRTGASGPVACIRIRVDGRIVVGGIFEMVGGRTSRKLACLNADGSNDLSFRPPNPNGDLREIVSLPDGRLLISGAFTSVGGQNRRFVTLLQADGTVDPTFDPGLGPDRRLGAGTSGWNSHALSLRADGTLYLTGAFQRFNGLAGPGLVQLRLGEVAPRLRGTTLDEGGLRSIVHGFPGGAYPLDASTDLKQWEPAGEVRLEGYDHTADFTAPTLGETRFFRLQPPAP